MNKNIDHRSRRQQTPGRAARQWKVIAVPTGEQQTWASSEVLMTHSEQQCRDYYGRLARDGFQDERALVLVDGFGMPVYANSP